MGQSGIRSENPKKEEEGKEEEKVLESRLRQVDIKIITQKKERRWGEARA